MISSKGCVSRIIALGLVGLVGAACQQRRSNVATTRDATTDADAGQCSAAGDEKILPRARRIYHGTELPAHCVSTAQQRALGALTFQSHWWENACSGTLIADDVVLTAGHCVVDDTGAKLRASRVRFVIGRDAVNPDATFNVAEVFLHPEYVFSVSSAMHDVGLLRLQTPASQSGLDVVPIPPNWDPLDGLEGAEVQNGGYGDTHDNPDNHLRWWTVELVAGVYSDSFRVWGQGRSGVCQGDSGGPSLYLMGGDALRVIGTVSWGDPTCVDYDWFSRTDDSRPFIEASVGAIDGCAGLSSAGRCDGDVALWCDAGVLRQQCCAETGGACADDGRGNYRCAGVDPCAGLDFTGRCEGNDAVWCAGGTVRRRRCGDCGQTCGPTGSDLGNYCL